MSRSALIALTLALTLNADAGSILEEPGFLAQIPDRGW